MRIAAYSLLLVGLAATARGQGGNLAGFLQAHPPAGTWIAVDPGHVRAKVTPNDLSAFERKAVPVGRLTAVVPTTMVTIDDSLAQAPNLYDGLPREAKILALMAALSPGQWRLLGERGLGLNDLRGEPRAILASLLSPPLHWDRYHLHDGVMFMRETEHLTLDPKDAPGVRLRLYREIELMVHPEGQRGGFFLSFGPKGVENGTIGRLSTKAEADSVYGVAIRQTVPNRPKPGGIRFDDRAYDAPVSPVGATTVREALTLASKATGREILADLRIADLPVAASGGAVRAGDLLGAIALAVTGTYRPVGPGFVLTSDLVGLGTRKMRIDRWMAGVGKGVQARSAEWNGTVVASGGLAAIGYPANAMLRVDDELQRKLDAQSLGMPPDFATSALPPEFNEALIQRRDEFAKGNPNLAFATDRVGVQSNLKFAFVLPDGTEIEGGTLPPRQAFGRPAPPEREAPPASPRATMPEGDKAASLVLCTEGAAEAAEAIRVANTYGFRELWLETHDSAALREAIMRAGRPVRLVVRPWTAQPGAKPADPDRTLLGDRAAEVLARETSNPSVTRFRMPDAPTPLGRDLLAPGDRENGPRFKALAALAGTPGLAGVVVMDSQPGGYVEGARTDGDDDFGYASAARWWFLRENGIDPLDIVPQGGSRDLELRQPFFPDNALMSLAAMNDEGRRREPEAQTKAYGKWRTFRAEANRRATESLFASFGAVRTLVAVRQASTGSRYTRPPLVLWHLGDPLPTSAEFDAKNPFLTTTALQVAASDGEAELRVRLANPDRARTQRITLDLSDVPSSKWLLVLDRILKRRS